MRLVPLLEHAHFVIRQADLERCQAFFRDQLQLPLRIYAFPNGSHRPQQIDLLERRGVEHVLIVGERYASGSSHVYPRFTYYADSTSEARLRALGYRTASSLRSALRMTS